MPNNAKLKRRAKGERPYFFDDPAVDKLLATAVKRYDARRPEVADEAERGALVVLEAHLHVRVDDRHRLVRQVGEALFGPVLGGQVAATAQERGTDEEQSRDPDPAKRSGHGSEHSYGSR